MFIQDLMELRIRRANALAAKKTARDVVIGLGLGLALGATAGMLLAPKSGKETREEIATGTREVLEQVREQVEETNQALKREVLGEEGTRNAKAAPKKATAKANEEKPTAEKVVAGKGPVPLKKKVA